MFILAICFTAIPAMAECPEGTIPCTIGGEDACCPVKSSDGIRGEIETEGKILLASKSGDIERCTAGCNSLQAKCLTDCLQYSNEAEWDGGRSPRRECRDNCYDSNTACRKYCYAD